MKRYCIDCKKEIKRRDALRCHSCCKKGALNHRYGVGHTQATCEKISNMRKNKYSGSKNPNWHGGRPICKECGKTISYGSTYCATHKYFGKRSPNYIDGRTPFRFALRTIPEYREWRTNIFKRDNYTCQKCGKTDCFLEAHHLDKMSNLVQEFLKEYSQFSPVEDKETLLRLAMKYTPFWNAQGQTLCKVCHNMTKRVEADA